MQKHAGYMVECGDIDRFNLTRSTRKVLDVMPSKQFPERQIKLAHHSAGYELAGSAMRWTEEVYSVTFELDGAIHGRKFHNSQDALALFMQWTGVKFYFLDS